MVEPIVSPETVAPTRAVESACPECTLSGNEALAKAGKRGRTKTPETPTTDDNDPAPNGAD
jgi:hypothetical protein